MMNDQPTNNSFPDRELKNAFESWNPEWNPESLWEKLSDTLNFEEELQEMMSDFDSDGDQSPPEIWDKLSASLDAEHTDKILQESFAEWQPQPNPTVWEKIDESVELEKVWVNLNEDLAKHTAVKSGFIVQLAALVAVLLLTFQINDERSSFHRNAKDIAILQPSSQPVMTSGVFSRPIKRSVDTHQSYLHRSDKVNTSARSTFSSSTELQPVFSDNRAQFGEEHKAINESMARVNKLNLLRISEFPSATPLLTHNHSRQSRQNRRILHLGLNYFSAINFLDTEQKDALTSSKGSFGHEFGLVVSHPIKRVSQEYFLNYCTFRQLEEGYKNGTFAQSDLRISGFKFNTFTKVQVLKKLNYGMGLSVFFPTQSIKERNNTIIEIPKTSVSNVGFNVGLDYHQFNFSGLGNLFLAVKYELIFPVNPSYSSQKNYQSFSVGLKYKI